MENDERLVVVLPKEDKDGLRQVAEKTRTTTSAIVRRLVVDFLAEQKGPPAIDKK